LLTRLKFAQGRAHFVCSSRKNVEQVADIGVPSSASFRISRRHWLNIAGAGAGISMLCVGSGGFGHTAAASVGGRLAQPAMQRIRLPESHQVVVLFIACFLRGIRDALETRGLEIGRARESIDLDTIFLPLPLDASFERGVMPPGDPAEEQSEPDDFDEPAARGEECEQSVHREATPAAAGSRPLHPIGIATSAPIPTRRDEGTKDIANERRVCEKAGGSWIIFHLQAAGITVSYAVSVGRTFYKSALYVLVSGALIACLLCPWWRRKPLRLTKLPQDLTVFIPCEPGNTSGSTRAVYELLTMFQAATRTRVVEMEKLLPPMGPLRRMIARIASKVFPIPPAVAQSCVNSSKLREIAGTSEVVIVEFLLSAFFLVARRPLAQPTVLRDHEVLVRRAWLDFKAAGGLQRMECLLHVCALWLLTLHCYRQVDRIVALTAEDAAFAKAILPWYAERIVVVPISFEPHGVESAQDAGRVGARNHLVLAANFWHRPNVDGLMWFLSECAPFLKNEVVLHLVGIDEPLKNLAENHGKVRVVRHGHVETWKPPLTECTMAISPIISGTGVRVKNLFLSTLSMAIVTTSLGNEGIDLRDGEEVMIRDAPQGFASAVDALVSDPALAVRMGRAAKTKIDADFSRQRALGRWSDNVFSQSQPEARAEARQRQEA
jgi:glycosyltransferase involved in cell wall biosynthesis